ncbi:DcrB-related protein [Acetobacter nitrogenifigens]|nr:DcrB-related protein [Acetobacter nitrogenifigens]
MSNGERPMSLQGMTITCPEGWRDASMLIVSASAPSPSGLTPNLVITRETLSDSLPEDRIERLHEFVDRQIDQMETALADFREVSLRRATSARLTVELTIAWTSGGVPVTQSITYAYAGEKTVVISTATASQDHFSEIEPQFTKILQSFRIT